MSLHSRHQHRCTKRLRKKYSDQFVRHIRRLMCAKPDEKASQFVVTEDDSLQPKAVRDLFPGGGLTIRQYMGRRARKRALTSPPDVIRVTAVDYDTRTVYYQAGPPRP